MEGPVVGGRFVEVVVDLAAGDTDRLYTYEVPEDLRGVIGVGSLVTVPFGRGVRSGVVAGVDVEPVPGVRRLIDAREGTRVPKVLIELGAWLAEAYLCRKAQAVRAIVPKGLRVSRAKGRSRAGVPGGGVPVAAASEPGASHRLTAGQDAALAAIEGAMRGRRPEVLLLHGATGSGKTEVYLQAAERALHDGRQVLMLVPEISLTPQVASWWAGRFGGAVEVLHSRLAPRERLEAWERIAGGAVPVVLGARSAVFAPLPRLGLIVVDEEHETAYKQEEVPRYHARDVALERGRRECVPVVLGSATPSVETYRKALAGEVTYLRLPDRVAGRPFPPIEVVDMREELARGNRGLLSEGLTAALQECVAAGEQAVLFLNRRGYATVVLCRECGYVVRCPSCDTSLTFHRPGRVMRCHYCDRVEPPPERCPNCAGRRIRFLGGGTQRLEEAVQEAVPAARVLRFDADTTRGRGAHRDLYDAFRSGEADVLVGTQMIAKGWDVERVTLAAVVLADTGLHLPDFRSAERTFQRVIQVAGRAGRGARPGRVFVQTYTPEERCIQAAAQYDFNGFAAAELAQREIAGYPPFRELVRLILTGVKEPAVRRSAERLAAMLRDRGDPVVEVLGAAPAPFSLLRGAWRWHVLVKAPPDAGVREFVREALTGWRPLSGVRLAVDVDPQSLL